jgi:hypothetical protein
MLPAKLVAIRAWINWTDLTPPEQALAAYLIEGRTYRAIGEVRMNGAIPLA